jgi:hypothetical protein
VREHDQFTAQGESHGSLREHEVEELAEALVGIARTLQSMDELTGPARRQLTRLVGALERSAPSAAEVEAIDESLREAIADRNESSPDATTAAATGFSGVELARRIVVEMSLIGATREEAGASARQVAGRDEVEGVLAEVYG